MSTLIHDVIKDHKQISGIAGNFPLDEAVIDALRPLGATVISADSYGSSAWTITARVLTQMASGETKRFFLKVQFFFGCTKV